ncbi:uncharacterized protein [Ptychodera flava]|uniref:uncharacterized protein isoform X2 n=1 Tax=Ptychodera flava TaxID=63121 RepID=UPI003969BF22
MIRDPESPIFGPRTRAESHPNDGQQSSFSHAILYSEIDETQSELKRRSNFRRSAIDDAIPATKQRSVIEESFRPLLLIMSAFGLLFPSDGGQDDNCRKLRCRKATFLKFYTNLVVVLVWSAFVRYVIGVVVGDIVPTHITTAISVGVWYFQSACNAAICLFHSFRSHRLLLFFHNWQTCWQDSLHNTDAELKFPRSWIKKRVCVMLFLSITFVVVATAYPAVGRYGSNEALRNETFFVTSRILGSSADPFFIVLHCYAAGAWVFPVVPFIIICSVLTHQFEKVTKKLESSIDHTGRMTYCLRTLRRQHQTLCRAVNEADDIFSFFILVTLSTSFVLVCFLLHQILNGSGTIALMGIVWFGANTVNIAIICWYTASLHEKAHSPFRYLHNISVLPGKDQHLQLMLFLSKLQGECIGFTMWGILVPTKEFIIAVLGAFVTYFSLIAQIF